MHSDLYKRRAVLIQARMQYDRADADWRAGLRRAAELVPGVRGRSYWSIGNPGSPLRRLFERRDRALQRLTVAMVKLETARERLRRRQSVKKQERLLLLYLSD